MKFINSQYINAEMTHCTVQNDYLSMRENGINIRVKDGLLYKPPGFWISVNYGWEEWSGAEEFQQDRNVQCNVYVKPNLTFIKISTVEEANELAMFLLPDLFNIIGMQDNVFSRMFPTFSSWPEMDRPISDLISFSRYEIYMTQKTGKPVRSIETWKKALESCDGIYYENSWDLHMDTFFNTWDCDSLILFDPSNVISIMKRDRDYSF